MKFLRRIGLEPFVLMLFGSIFVAWLAPSIGMDREPISLGDIATWGVSLIFLFYGLRLDWSGLKAGLVNTRLHILIHVSTFVLFPLIVLAAMWLFGGFGAEGNRHYLWIGTFFLAALPSTVSSSVVMVSIAGGNMPAAIFNASISSLLGVFLTPLWMGIFINNIDGMHGLGDVILKLVIQVIVPVCAGIALNPKFGAFAQKHKKKLRLFDEAVILMIVYTSFCNSFEKKMFDGFALSELAVLSACMIALFIAVFVIIWKLSHAMGFSREDSITATFCGSKKSLVHGSVMSKVLFDNAAAVGVVLLPTMLYHAVQLIIVSIIAKRMGEKSKNAP